MRFSPVCLFLAAGCAHPQAQLARGSGPQTVLLVSLDGFRPDYLDRPQAEALRTIARAGVRASRMDPVFPTLTFPNHYTQVTGLYPEHHGIVGNTIEDPLIGRFSIGDTLAVRDGRWWGGEPLWVTAERQGVRAAAYFWVGSEAPIGGVRPTWYTRFDNEVPYAVRVRRVLDWLSLPPDSAPRLITTYFSAPDGAGHRSGPGSAAVDSAIAQVDSAVGALWRGIGALGLGDRVNLVVVSDHGMAQLSRGRVIFLDDHLELGSWTATEMSPVAMITPSPGRLEEVYRRLLTVPHLTVYRREEIPARLHFRSHPRIPPLIAIAEEGWSITTRAFFESRPAFATGGTHGFDPVLPSMSALFLAAGPAFPSGRVVPRVRAVDLYALLTHVLGLRPAPNDGLLDSVRVVLK